MVGQLRMRMQGSGKKSGISYGSDLFKLIIRGIRYGTR